MRVLALILTILLFASCSLSKQERRMNRATKKLEKLVVKFPELERIDTVIVPVTIITPGLKADTVFSASSFLKGHNDTLSLIKDNLSIKLRLFGDSIAVEAEIKPKKNIQYVKVPCTTIHPTRTIYTPRKIPPILIVVVVAFFALVTLLALVAGYFIGKRKS